jgi:hypothetical protein
MLNTKIKELTKNIPACMDLIETKIEAQNDTFWKYKRCSRFPIIQLFLIFNNLLYKIHVILRIIK